MAYCSNCKSVVHRTTKICPSCGGDFSKLFGPNALWGKPPKEAVEVKNADQIAALKSAEEKIHQEYLDRKAAVKVRQKVDNRAISAKLKRDIAAGKGPSATKIWIWILTVLFLITILNQF